MPHITVFPPDCQPRRAPFRRPQDDGDFEPRTKVRWRPSRSLLCRSVSHLRQRIPPSPCQNFGDCGARSFFPPLERVSVLWAMRGSSRVLCWLVVKGCSCRSSCRSSTAAPQESPVQLDSQIGPGPAYLRPRRRRSGPVPTPSPITAANHRLASLLPPINRPAPSPRSSSSSSASRPASATATCSTSSSSASTSSTRTSSPRWS